MAISASSVASSSTLNTLRTQFNNLVTDVTAIEGGSITYTTLNTTTTNATTLNVKEDGTIVFEGATDDAYETTLTVTDPTADRTITFPNETGTVFTSGGAIALGGNITKASDLTVDVEGDISLDANGGDVYLKDNGTIYGTLTNNGGNLTIKNSSSEVAAIQIAGDEVITFADDLVIKDGGTIGASSATTAITIASTGIVTFVDNILIKNAGTIGSAGDPNAIGISSGGVVSITATTANTSASDGALTVAGGAGIAADLTVGDDLRLITDSAVLSFGADSDTTLTHTDGTGLTLNSTNKLCFNDASQFIQGASATVLDIAATDEIELTATLIDIVGRAEISGNLTVGGDLDVTGSLDMSDANLTNVGSIQLDSIAGDGDTNTSITFSGTDVITIATGGTTAATFNASQILTLADDLVIKDGGTIGVTSAATAITIASSGIVTLVDDLVLKDAATIGVTSSAGAISIASTGIVTFVDDIIIKDAGTIGSASVPGAVSISSGGVVNIAATTASTNSTTGALTDAGGMGVAADLGVGDDIFMITDGSLISFGLNSEITLTHVADVGLTLTHTAAGDNTPIVLNLKSEEDAIIADEEIGRIDFTAGDSSGTDAILTAASIVAVAEDTFAADNNSTGLAFKLGLTTAATEMFRMDHDGDFKIITDGSAIAFGANNEIELTHVHNTGLLLTDSGGSPTLQLHDANESVSSDGSNLIITSGGTAYTLTATDGSDGHFLKTDGSGALTFAAASVSSLACDDLTVGNAAVLISTSSGNITVDATANDSDIIFKGTDGTADTTFLTIDGSEGGTLIANNDLELGTDASVILFGADNEITLTHVHDVGLTLTHTASGDNLPIVLNLKSEEDAVIADEEIGRIDFTAGDSGGSDAILTAASIAAVAEDTFAADNNSTGLAFKLGVSATAAEMFRMTHDGDFKVITDGSAIGFGANNEIELTHVHDTGLLLTDSGGTPTLQFHDANESISSDGGHLIFTSNGVSFDFPSADGDDGQVLTTDGSGVIAWEDGGGGGPAGKQTMWIPAAAMYQESTNGCSALAQLELSNGPEIKTLDFATGADEFAQFTVAFPKEWNEGTVTFQAFFTVTGTNTGTTAWGLAGVAFGDNNDQNTAFGTTVVATAKAHSGTSNDLDVSAESGAVTIAGSPAVDELVYFQIMRDVSADDQSGDSRLLGIKLFFTTDAANSA